MYTIGYVVFGWDLAPWLAKQQDQSLWEFLGERVNTTSPTFVRFNPDGTRDEIPNPDYGKVPTGPYSFDKGFTGLHTAYSGSADVAPIAFGLAIAQFDETETVDLEDTLAGSLVNIKADYRVDDLRKELDAWLDSISQAYEGYDPPLTEEEVALFNVGLASLREHTSVEPRILIVWGTS